MKWTLAAAAFALVATAIPSPSHASFRFAEGEDPLAAAREGAPMALTASDGTGLVLVEMEANAVIEGPLAFTELRLTFQNPLNRVLEGRFQITLPSRASVSRFAMKTNTRWQEGEVIERERARRVYEDFLHRKQDPALLEQGEANEFGARVFPIPAKGKKELILSYAQPLAGRDQAYVLPLRGLSRIGKLAVTVSGGAAPFSMKKTAYVPSKDIVVQQTPGRDGLRHDDLVAVRVRPVKSDKKAKVDSLLFLVDTSASRALAMPRQIKLIQSLSKALVDNGAPKTPVGIVAFDQSSEVIFTGTADGVDSKVLRKLRRRRALGASDYGDAFIFAASLAKKHKYKRALLISDGVATAGLKEGKPLAERVNALRLVGVERLDAAVLGGLRDEDRLRAMTSGPLPLDGAVIDADRGVRHVADKMTRSTASKVALQVEGAEWTWPTEMNGIQAGDDVLVFARLEKGVKDVRLRVNNKRAGSVVVKDSARPMLERAVVEAEIARLTAARNALTGDKVASERKRLKDTIVSLSTKHRVLSRFTSLLVLETAADYARYGITETALSDVLTVKGGKIVVDNSRALPPKPKPKPKPKPVAKLETKSKSAKKGKKKRGMARPAMKPASGASADDDEMDGDRFADKEANDEMESEPVSSADAEAPMEEIATIQPDLGGAPSDSERDSRPMPPAASAPRSVGNSTGRFGGGGQGVARTPPPAPARQARRRPEPPAQPVKLPPADAWTGKFADVMKAIQKRKLAKALTTAQSWREEEPGDVLALVALGRAYAAKNDVVNAARAYGSIIDLFPARADLRRFAGNLLESVNFSRALVLAAESYGEATVQRRDHPAGWRLYAFALARLNRFDEAMTALETGITTPRPSGRFSGVQQILLEDLGIVGAMAIKNTRKRAEKKAIEARVKKAGATLETKASVRFVLSWETDANDVDFHIYDARGGHAYYGSKNLPNGGGSLYADVTTGYGPECFTVRKKASKRAGPYRMRAHYYSRGPMGYGMGALQVIDNVNGKVSVTTKPFVVMKDSAYVDLGVVKR